MYTLFTATQWVHRRDSGSQGREAKDGRSSLLSLRQAWFDFDFTQEDNDDKVMKGEKGEQVVPCP